MALCPSGDQAQGVSKQLLWEEYTPRYPNSCYSYSQFCDYYKFWRQLQKRSMLQIHKPGEKLFIDYCGPMVPIVSPATGEVRQAQIFVAVLGASNYTFLRPLGPSHCRTGCKAMSVPLGFSAVHQHY